MKRRHLLGLGIIAVLIFIAFCAIAFSKSLTPYVNFDEAKKSDKTVQVRGYITGPVSPLGEGYGITFDLTDGEGITVTVVYQGIKPNNLEQAESVVVVGRYQDPQFKAEKILVKCPSKYQTKED